MRLSLKRGFTLIELLVVIAIIAILAAILFPVFAKARSRATAIACLNNMKQIGTAVQMYLADSDGKYPMNRYEPEPAPHNWRTSLFPYIRSEDVLKCPNNEGAKAFPRIKEESGNYPISYSTNGSVFHEGAWRAEGGVNRPASVTLIKDPAGTLYIVESRGRWPDLGPWALGGPTVGDPYRSAVNPRNGAFQTHEKRMNAVFADSHAKSVTIKETLDKDMWKSKDPNFQGDNLKNLYNYILAEYR
jgi:prepilin-type N-terminal cleavage/methylation domain-containing protein